MAKQNWYASVTMSYSIVKDYYLDDPNFDHFVFQQMIDDGEQANDVYTLIGYAIGNNGDILASFSLTDLDTKSFKADKQVQFANMKMDQTDLGKLYPPGVQTDITLTPKGFLLGGTYVYYMATTGDGAVVGGSAQINPSPPY